MGGSENDSYDRDGGEGARQRSEEEWSADRCGERGFHTNGRVAEGRAGA